MSDATADGSPNQLNLKEQLVRIDRAREEALKFSAEQRKLIAEAEKFSAEQRKLAAEAMKFQRDHRFAPALLLVAALGSVSAAVAAVFTLLRTFAPR